MVSAVNSITSRCSRPSFRYTGCRRLRSSVRPRRKGYGNCVPFKDGFVAYRDLRDRDDCISFGCARNVVNGDASSLDGCSTYRFGWRGVAIMVTSFHSIRARSGPVASSMRPIQMVRSSGEDHGYHAYIQSALQPGALAGSAAHRLWRWQFRHDFSARQGAVHQGY